jgi:hypothetical protein
VLLHNLIECLWSIKYFQKEKIHAKTGTRTNIVCLQRVLPSHVNALGYLWVRQTTTLSQHASSVRKLASKKKKKIYDFQFKLSECIGVFG